MGDSACLLPSISCLSPTSRQPNPVDLNITLGESISLGRFMPESLAWEKWSIFTHNRYLEEAEKFSRRGFVAEKKAYFEAHYKRKAAEKAAPLLHEPSNAAKQISNSENEDQNFSNSCNVVKSELQDHALAEKQLEEEDVSLKLVDYNDSKRNNCECERNELDAEIEKQEVVLQDSVDVEVNGEHSTLVNKSDKCNDDKDGGEISILKEERKSDEEAASKKNKSLITKKQVIKCPSKTSTKSRALKFSSSPPLPKRKSSTRSREERIDGCSKSEEPGGVLVEKKRLSSTSLCVSVNVDYCVEVSKRISSMLQKNGNTSTDAAQNKTSMDSSAAPRTLTRASTKCLPKQPTTKPRLKENRTEASLDKSLSRGVTPHTKVLPLSTNCLNSSIATGISTRSTTKISPFRFRSEERAAKRKEFFQRMEEKAKNNDEKVHPLTRTKDNADHKLQQSNSSKFNLNEDSPSQRKKIQVTQPKSPQLGRKTVPSIVQKSISQHSFRLPPVCTRSSKGVSEKRNQTRTHSTTSLPKISTHENASPNIPH